MPFLQSLEPTPWCFVVCLPRLTHVIRLCMAYQVATAVVGSLRASLLALELARKFTLQSTEHVLDLATLE